MGVIRMVNESHARSRPTGRRLRSRTEPILRFTICPVWVTLYLSALPAICHRSSCDYSCACVSSCFKHDTSCTTSCQSCPRQHLLLSSLPLVDSRILLIQLFLHSDSHSIPWNNPALTLLRHISSLVACRSSHVDTCTLSGAL